MTPEESADLALFRVPLPEGFCRRVFRVAPGRELGMDATDLRGAIVLVEQGELELECRAGGQRRFGPGSMLAIARLPVARVRSVGRDPLVLVAVSRASPRATDDFLPEAGSHVDC
jgi:mannose-6-phosphate isomerase-like protein (cupin superfamily)